MASLNTDIYNISQTILDIQKDHFEEQSDDTLALGMYGFINAVTSKMLQTSIKVASELSNEIFPTKARLERNIMTHAITNNITDINAVPAKMDIILCLLESDFDALLEEQNTESIVIDKNCKFFVGDYEYHLDYDMIISKSILANNTSVYTARYNMNTTNTLSDIEIPYLSSPYIVKQNADTYIFISCHIRQIEHNVVYNKIISNDTIDNKTYEFEFENQLASFDVYIKEGNSIIYLIPVLEGGNTDGISNYCWYTFMDSTTVRVKFDSMSYMPKINTEIETDIKTTLGEKCNFKYTEEIISTLADTSRYAYNRMQIAILPVSESRDGQDKKSMEELKRMLPKEALSRGGLITTTDINNYFNSLNNRNNRIVFREKIHNQFMRSYYSYLLLKDTFNNIIPTNTIDIFVKLSDFDIITNPDNPDIKQYILKQGRPIGYKKNDVTGSWVGSIVDKNSISSYDFAYTIPFKTVINHIGPFISYYMAVMNDNYKLLFKYINNEVPLQFICSTINWSRSILKDTDRYILRFNLKQNIDMDMGIEYEEEIEDDEGNITTISKTNIKVIAIVYDELETPYRYMIAEPDTSIEADEFSYNYKFDFITDDIINEDNRIRIENVYLPKAEGLEYQYGYFQQTSQVDIYVLSKFKDEEGNEEELGFNDLDDIVPMSELEGYSVTNTYSIMNGVSFFDNYSSVISTVVTPEQIYDEETDSTVEGFKLSSIPVVKHSFLQNNRNINNFTNSIKIRKAYIDNALKILENQFSIDFKFFNTYGPAKVYTVDGGELDRVNIGLRFNLSLKNTSDGYTKEYIIKFIKDYIENLDNIGTDLHMPNLISEITKTYISSINYIEFTGFNKYNTIHQHLNYSEEEEYYGIPEFINVNILPDNSHDIEIRIL